MKCRAGIVSRYLGPKRNGLLQKLVLVHIWASGTLLNSDKMSINYKL